MARYTGARTPHALRSAKTFIAGKDFEAMFATHADMARQVMADRKKRAFLGAAAEVCEGLAHARCKGISDIAGIDFGYWRLATELRLLERRLEIRVPRKHPDFEKPMDKYGLHLAISLALTDRERLARATFKGLARGIGRDLDYMEMNRKRPRDWGAVGFVFHAMLAPRDVPPRFGPAGPLTLAAAKAARPSYSYGADPFGALLGAHNDDLIPVELIFVSRALGHPDPVLARLDAGLRATTYPGHPLFQELDMEMSVAGY